MKICKITSCRAKQWARGWCRNHYARWQRRGGNPAINLKSRPDCKYCGQPCYKKRKVNLCYFCYKQYDGSIKKRWYQTIGGYQGLSEKAKNTIRKGHHLYYYKNREKYLEKQNRRDRLKRLNSREIDQKLSLRANRALAVLNIKKPKDVKLRHLRTIYQQRSVGRKTYQEILNWANR